MGAISQPTGRDCKIRKIVFRQGQRFSHLVDPEEFKKVGLVDGVMTWPGEIGIAPTVMHDQIKQNGKVRVLPCRTCCPSLFLDELNYHYFGHLRPRRMNYL